MEEIKRQMREVTKGLIKEGLIGRRYNWIKEIVKNGADIISFARFD